MNARLAKHDDLQELKEMWKLCFGDTDQFIDFYFRERDWKREVAVLIVEETIVSMLTMISVKMMEENSEIRMASMIYGVATHPDHQKKGYAEQLMKWADDHLLTEGTAFVMLVPAGDELFKFYKKRGYETVFYLREAVFEFEEIYRLAETRSTFNSGSFAEEKHSLATCVVKSAEPLEYNEIREKRLNGERYVGYFDRDIFFQKGESQLVGMDIFSIESNGERGCAAVEITPEGVVVIKELLIAETELSSALAAIADLLKKQTYLVRTPVSSGELLGGRIREFGMIKANRKEDEELFKQWTEGMNSYLGIAYD